MTKGLFTRFVFYLFIIFTISVQYCTNGEGLNNRQNSSDDNKKNNEHGKNCTCKQTLNQKTVC